MRRKIATTLAFLLVLAAPATVSANAGLPKLAGLDLGTYHVQISGDSPSLHTGTNTLTVAINDFPADAPLNLKVLGPSGQVVDVPLSPLTVLSGPADDHDMSNMDMSAASGHGTTTDTHTSQADSHGTTAAAATATGHDDGHDDHAAASFNVRGKAVINETGTWRFVLETQDHHGAVVKAEASVDAKQGGPSRVYLSFTGALIVGSLTYGGINRRRQPAGGR